MNKRPIVIDCDPGVDDAYALMLAASRPELDIRAVNPVSGNVVYEHTSQNALRLRDFLGLFCRVGRGAEKPMIIPVRDSEGIHGANGMGGYELPPASGTFDEDYAWDILYQEAEAAKGELEVVALGPLTNIAISLLRYPDLGKQIKKITLMGGSAGMGNTSAYAEFNIWADPHAAEVVFASGVPIAMAGFDGCMTCGLTEEEFRGFAMRPGKLQPLSGALCDALLGGYHGFGLDRAVIFDLIAMACFLEPEIATYKACFVEVETRSSLSAGQTVVDLYRLSKKEPNADVLLTVDKDCFLAIVCKMMDHYA